MNRTEPVELTNMCMVYRGDELLVQNRFHKDWHGVIFPGGHVEPGEMFSESVIREIKEETGLTIFQPKLCGISYFYIKLINLRERSNLVTKAKYTGLRDLNYINKN